VVDYAHTPDALRKALSAARAHCAGRLAWCSVAAAIAIRQAPIMGAIAAELADDIVITDDNPRTESPRGHRRGHRGRHSGRQAVPHRARSRPRDSRSGRGRAADDVVLIAGKGHEDYQIYGSERRAFSDQKAVAARSRARAAVRHERTLAEFARACGGELHGADRAYTGVSTTRARSRPGELFVALRGRASTPTNSSRPRSRRRGWRGGRHASRPPHRADRGARHADALTESARAGARNSRCRGRRRRQQRQDHGQGDDRRDPRARADHAGDARQPQQPHRRAAHAASARAAHRYAVVEIGRTSRGEVAALSSSRVRRSDSSPTRARNISRVRQHRRAARAEGEMVAGLEPSPPRCSTPTTNSRAVARHDARAT
jgi:hypothetical protein